MRSRTIVTSGLCSVALAVAVTGVSQGGADAASTSGSGYDLLLTFDGGGDGAPSLESDGWAPVRTAVSSVSPGAVTSAPDRTGGRALRTERFDLLGLTPPAVVVVRAEDGASDVTNPRHGDFSFGAWFTLDALSEGSPDDNGNNLVQRGLSRDVSQYKIQLDDRQPLCRVAGSDGSVIVRADTRVQPDTWYRAKCRRIGNEVRLRLATVTQGGDLAVEEWSAYGAIGSVSWPAGEQPLSIGGKVGEDGRVLLSSSDQFNGRIDDVFFRSLS